MSTPLKIIFWIFVGFGSLLTFAILTIFGPIFLVKGVNETILYINERDNTIQVQATVTDIHESTDSEGGSNISVYVSYEYNDISYEDVYWKLVSSESEYSINETVSVEIFKSKPNSIVNVCFGVYIGWLFPLCITIAELLLAKFLIGELIKTIKTHCSC